jgi:hypothetical protein
MVLARNYQQVFAGATAGVVSGHNIRTAKFSDLDTAAMFKLTASEIGDVKFVRRSAEECVVHSPPTAEKMYENGCTNFRRRRRMYEFLVVVVGWVWGGGSDFFGFCVPRWRG